MCRFDERTGLTCVSSNCRTVQAVSMLTTYSALAFRTRKCKGDQPCCEVTAFPPLGSFGRPGVRDAEHHNKWGAGADADVMAQASP